MGNFNSIHYMYKTNKNNKNNKNNNCLICSKKVELEELVECTRCNIKMHDYCYENISKTKNLTYTKCPNCPGVGTLGQELYYKYRYEK